jgi:UDP-2,3-diacylglucosamine hydrolase
MNNNTTHQITLHPSQKVYFASDFHLGAPDWQTSRLREDKIVRWLTQIQADAAAVFLVGDIFDFWFEYRHAIPKGFIRLQGKLAELTDSGIPVVFFSGNHDMWMFDYFKKELNIPIYHQPQTWLINDVKFLIGHGDGLGPGDFTYKIIKRIFRNPICQWLFARLHPNFGIGLASYLSRNSRARNMRKNTDDRFLGEKEWLVQYCTETEAKTHHDYYIFGHRHLPLDLEIAPNSRYVNLGEWLKYDTYAAFDGGQLRLSVFEK